MTRAFLESKTHVCPIFVGYDHGLRSPESSPKSVKFVQYLLALLVQLGRSCVQSRHRRGTGSYRVRFPASRPAFLWELVQVAVGAQPRNRTWQWIERSSPPVIPLAVDGSGNLSRRSQGAYDLRMQSFISNEALLDLHRGSPGVQGRIVGLLSNVIR